jgi:hypothetical protein
MLKYSITKQPPLRHRAGLRAATRVELATPNVPASLRPESIRCGSQDDAIPAPEFPPIFFSLPDPFYVRISPYGVDMKLNYQPRAVTGPSRRERIDSKSQLLRRSCDGPFLPSPAGNKKQNRIKTI